MFFLEKHSPQIKFVYIIFQCIQEGQLPILALICSLFEPWEIFHAFFVKINFFEKLFQEFILVSNRLDADQAGHFVGPDLGPICLQQL